ncbi:g6271 [Coccomyxa viridis]|uniref:G6271 protein n=1 Tax=Coccomyxa viridis TaxID=1274662 RepID=A0ABP1FXH3_9CHLO
MASSMSMAMQSSQSPLLRSSGRTLSKPFSRAHPRHLTIRGSIGSDAAGGFMDLSKLVSGGGKLKGAYGDLAYKIGKEVYVDVQGWHLFLKEITVEKDVKMHQALASQLGPMGEPSESDVEGVLKKIPLSLGGGKQKVSLYDALPAFGIKDLAEIVAEFTKNQ